MLHVAPTPPHPLARQLARLLAESELDELGEIVRRWIAEATSEQARAQCRELAERLVALKRELSAQPKQPTREELELALTVMLELASHADRQVPPP